MLNRNSTGAPRSALALGRMCLPRQLSSARPRGPAGPFVTTAPRLLRRSLLIAAAMLCAAGVSRADLYSNNFETNTTASWTLNGGPSDEVANFFFDYSTVGIPSAPGSGGT